MRHFKFHEHTYRELLKTEDGLWVIDTRGDRAPILVRNIEEMEEVPVDIGKQEIAPETFQKEEQARRLKMIQSLILDNRTIMDPVSRNCISLDIAKQEGLGRRTVLRYYYAYLAQGPTGLYPAKRVRRKKEPNNDERAMLLALNTFYYSPRKMSLSMTYEMMLLQSYRGEDGKILEEHPSFNQLRYMYDKTKNAKKQVIAREGIGVYRKDYRPLTGAGNGDIDKIGFFEMDATRADVYLVSRYDRMPVDRPYIYLAVDVVSRLIAGVHICFEAGQDAVMACLTNAACDKVAFCKRYGVKIEADTWPSCGLPGKVCTDRGSEFLGGRITELCETFRMEITSLPAYRPDMKGYVEKAFDVLQNRYKPLLHGKGVVEKNPMGVLDMSYAKQACLDIDEFTAIVLRCVLYYNAHRTLESFTRTPSMIQDDVSATAAALWNWYTKNGMSDMTKVNETDLRLLTFPRAQALITRFGLKHNNLLYTNIAYENRFVQAGLGRNEKVTIAYDPLCDDAVYMIQDKRYVPFTLAPSCKQFHGLSQAELLLLRAEEKENRKRTKEAGLQGRTQCTDEIMEIVRKREPGRHTTADIEADIRAERRKKEND